MDVSHLVVFCIALAAGGAVGWLMATVRSASRRAVLDREAAASAARANQLSESLLRLESALAEERSRCSALSADLASARSDNTHLAARIEEETARLVELKAQMSREFETLASKILEEKSSRFLDQNQQQLAVLLGPLRERIGEFRDRMEALHSAGEKSSATLAGQLKVLHELNQRMADEARGLATALKGQSKTQGSWGELVLEKILEKSGLTKGLEYVTQESITEADGTRRLPDVIIRLPEDRHLVIDAKVSLTAYERWANATEDARPALSREHVLSVRRHVDELSRKDYPSLPGLTSPDFVLMFVPVEPALHLALAADPSLYAEAFSKNVVLVSSSTLLVALRAVESVWRRHKQTLNAQEIARQAGKLHDAFVAFAENLELIANRLDQARAACDEAMNRLSTGRGNLVKRTLDLEKLGARAEKQMPASLTRMATEFTDES